TSDAPLLVPPATSTRPSDNRVAVCKARALDIVPVDSQAPVTGLYNSAAERLPLTPTPPVTSTLPFGSNVAVWRARLKFIGPTGVQFPVVESYSSVLLVGSDVM